jgi:hypothetical protein
MTVLDTDLAAIQAMAAKLATDNASLATDLAALAAGLETLASAIAASEQIVPSPSGSVITEGTTLPLIDASGNAWTLSGGVIFVNANPADFTRNAALLLFFAGAFYHQNTAGAWYQWPGTTPPASTEFWTPIAGDPRASLPTPAPAPLAAGFFVSPSGSDGNAGTLAAPFATLEKAQSAMRANATKITYLRAGTYNRTATLTLTAGSDDGEAWLYYPPDGVNTAILDGVNSLSVLVEVNADAITINGVKFQHPTQHAIYHDDGSTSIRNLTIENCDIGFNSAISGFPGLIHINGAAGVTIKNNHVHDAQSQGISLYSYQPGLVLDDVVVDSNIVLRAVQGQPDGGAIYIQHFNNYVASRLEVTNNYVKDYGSATAGDAHGIYLDEGTNHVTVSGNIIGPASAAAIDSTGLFLVDGYANHFTGNIGDLGTSGNKWGGVWWYPGSEGFTPSDNGFEGNIVVANFPGDQTTSAFGAGGYTFYQNGGAAGIYAIANNVYWNYGGGAMRATGPIASDTAPLVADPQISGWAYAIASGSPVFAAPVSFPPIVGGWGPIGFILPLTGAAPSPPPG